MAYVTYMIKDEDLKNFMETCQAPMSRWVRNGDMCFFGVKSKTAAAQVIMFGAKKAIDYSWGIVPETVDEYLAQFNDAWQRRLRILTQDEFKKYPYQEYRWQEYNDQSEDIILDMGFDALDIAAINALHKRLWMAYSQTEEYYAQWHR